MTRFLIASGVLIATAASTQAAIVFFTDEAAFNAARGGPISNLDIETFEEAADNFPDGTFDTFDAPLNASTSNMFFTPGEIATDLTVTQVGGTNTDGLAIARGDVPTIGTYSSVVVGTPGDLLTPPSPSSLALQFSTPVGAVRLDAFTAAVPTANAVVDVFNTIGVFLGSSSYNVANTGPGTFVGILSDSDDIGQVVLTIPMGIEVVDNVGFGPSAPAAVPEPSTSLLLALTGVIGGGLHWRRRRCETAAA